jgi:murein DD-endopeptidase MepM/ murein hydrolase activator NlpD
MIKFTVHIKSIAATITVSLIASLLNPSYGKAQFLSDQLPTIRLSANYIANGDVVLLEVDARATQLAVTDIHIEFNKRIYALFDHPEKDDGIFCALVGIPYRTKPGSDILTLKWTTTTGVQSSQAPLNIIAGTYKTDVLKVDSRRVNPNKEDQKRANHEHQEVKRIYASGNKTRLWDIPFQLPVENETSSLYGNKRVFNGQLKSYHNGLDFRSPQGTPAVAANTGIVRLAKNLFYSGDAVIVDHGTNIFTIYAHLSKIKVAAGQRIEKGQLIGLTGATGRVSGPHLHWGVKINGVAVNPLQFVDVISAMAREQ